MTEQTPKQMIRFYTVELTRLDASLSNMQGYQEGTLEGVTERQIAATANRAEISIKAMYDVLQAYQHQVDTFYAQTGLKRMKS